MDTNRKRILESHNMVKKMSFSEEIFGYAAAAVPGVGAGLLSLYNWYKMQGGAKLQVDPFVTYGLYRPKKGLRATAYDEKYLYIPILINNTGSKTGLVTNVEITFRSEKTEEKVLKIERELKAKIKEEQVEMISLWQFLNFRHLFPTPKALSSCLSV